MLAAGAGGATARGGPIGAPVGRGPAPPGIVEEEEQKKKLDPRIIGVVAFLFVAGIVGYFISNSMGGAPSDGDTSTITPVNPETPANPAPPPPGPSGPLPSIGSPGGNVGGAPAPPVPAQFTTVVPPNPKYATGTMGIMVTQANASQRQAAGIATFAKNQYARGGKWTSMQICVFSNQQSADEFRAYQNKRQGAPLTPADYQALSNVWSGAPAFLETNGKSEKVYYPSSNPSSWWPSR